MCSRNIKLNELDESNEELAPQKETNGFHTMKYVVQLNSYESLKENSIMALVTQSMELTLFCKL